MNGAKFKGVRKITRGNAPIVVIIPIVIYV